MSGLLYKALGLEFLRDIINDLQKASSQLEIYFFGVGAFARNVWYASDDKHPKGTKDVDIYNMYA